MNPNPTLLAEKFPKKLPKTIRIKIWGQQGKARINYNKTIDLSIAGRMIGFIDTYLSKK